MDLELCSQAQLMRWMNGLPLGAVVFLVETEPDVLDGNPLLPKFEHDGLTLSLGVLPVSMFGQATDADRERLAEAVSHLMGTLVSAGKAWLSILMRCRPAAVLIREEAIAAVVEAPSGRIPEVWRPVVDMANTG